jgi:uncharacterized protein
MAALARMGATGCVALVVFSLACSSAVPRDVAPASDAADPCALGLSRNPWLVGWREASRAELQKAMHSGVVAVASRCGHIELLPECTLPGGYQYMAVRALSESVHLESQAELLANSARTGAPTTTGECTAMPLAWDSVTVGRYTTALGEVVRSDLRGEGCERATHFVRTAHVGAARIRHLALSKAEDAGQAVDHPMGNVEGCQPVDLEASRPPKHCGKLLRLELVAVEPSDGGSDEQRARAEPCPRGLVSTPGKCAVAASGVPHQCSGGDAKGCNEQCELGHWGSCGALAVLYAEGAGVVRDLGRARGLFERACEGNEDLSCAAVGFLYLGGMGTEETEDDARAAEFMGRACHGGVAEACTALSFLYATGRGVAVDETQAARLAERACRGGDATGCFNAAAVILRGEARGPVARMVPFLERACSGGSQTACRQLALMYQSGQDVPGNQERTVHFLERACRFGDGESCQALGVLCVEGNLGDCGNASVSCFERACEGDSGRGCYNLGQVYATGLGAPRDDSRAVAAFKRSCELGDAEGCYNAGVMYDAGRGVAPSESKAIRYFERACQGEDRQGCFAAGVMHVQSEDRSAWGQAVPFWERACEQQHGSACFRLGKLYEEGWGIPQDLARAVVLHRRACEMGNGSGCASLGEMYAEGRGVHRSCTKALPLYEQACQSGVTIACAWTCSSP